MDRLVVMVVHCVRPRRDVPPTGQSLFFASPKKRNQKKGDPDGGGPARAGLLCGARCLGPRAELAVFAALTPLRQTSRSQRTKRADARGPKPLRSSTPPTGPKSNAVVCCANFPRRCLGADAQRGVWRRNRSMCAACPKHGVDRPNPCSRSVTPKSAGVRRLCFGYFHLTRQMKVTRPPGRLPGAPAGRQKNHPREAAHKEQDFDTSA